jgi:acyl-CoA synthetase (AMP-forming)/AMP-acid ligase II
VFKRHGEKVSMPDLLGTALSVGSVQAVMIRDVDPQGEEGAVLVVSPPPSDTEVKQVLKAYRAAHPRTHWPLRIESVEQFSELATGKIDVQGLPADPSKVVHWWQRL